MTDPALGGFTQAASLVAGSVFYLFASKSFGTVLKKVARVETRADSLKRRIIYLAKGAQVDPLLEFLEGLSPEDISSVGMDFLCITAKKLAKHHGAAVFGRFARVVFGALGFENGLVKIFLFGDRDINETAALLAGLETWADAELLHRAVVSVLDHLGSQGQVRKLAAIAERFGRCVRSETCKHSQRVAMHFFNSALQAGLDTASIIDGLVALNRIGLKPSYSVFNKMLDAVNKSARTDDLMSSLVAFGETAGIDFNLVTYNCILDHYCSSGRLDVARELYERFAEKGVQPDNYTFSILLKGVKADSVPDLGFARTVVDLYLARGDVTDTIILNSAIDVFLAHNAPDSAEEVLELIEARTAFAPDAVTYSTLIKGSCKNKCVDRALGYFRRMKAQGLVPNRIVYNTLMDLAVKDGKLTVALDLIEEMQRDAISADGYTYCIILNGLKINDSSAALVKLSLDNIKKVIAANQFRLDEALFNTILDVCLKYELSAELDCFYELMRVKGVAETPATYSTLIKAFSKQQRFDRVLAVFDKMLEQRIMLADVTYGTLMDACAKIGRMDYSLRIFDYLEALSSNMNSIIFTTMLKGFIRCEQLDEAIAFFERVRRYTHLNGMIITYNCALDLYVRKSDIAGALRLFDELAAQFAPDVVSFSTVIKGLILADRKAEAFGFVRRMIDAEPTVDVSVVNLFLDSCSTVADWKLGVQAYEHVMDRGVAPNEITFGIMVKIFGFARDLQRAFGLLDLMAAYNITASIVVYTNLIHVSFYNKNPKKADLAFTLFKRAGLKGDRLMYSKLIDGFMRFKEHARVVRYVDLALKDSCALKPATMTELRGYFHDDAEALAKLQKFSSVAYVESTQNADEKAKRMEAKKAQMKAKNKAMFDGNRNANNGGAEAEPREDTGKPQRALRALDHKKEANATGSGARQFNKTDSAKQTGFKADPAKKPVGLFNFRSKN